MKTNLPSADSRHQEWLFFANRWAELIVLWIKADKTLSEVIRKQLENLRGKVDTSFVAWIKNRYAGLHNQPAMPPVMLHHIPRALAHALSRSKEEKVAIVLVDGLAIDQWIVLREVLLSRKPSLRFRENAVFAWVPTITSVSRQAAFAGKPPLYFPSSIHTTKKDPAHWTQFWLEQGLAKNHVAYVKGLGNNDLGRVDESLSDPKIRAAALVIDKVDKIMHGIELGAAGMHNQVRQWAEQGFMTSLFDFLINGGFKIFLTSDHGNIEAKGFGRPSEGAVAYTRGERVRIYPSELLRSEVKERFPAAIEWPTIGLPDDFFPLLAPERFAFIKEGQKTVGHGSISMEELIVPFVQVERRTS